MGSTQVSFDVDQINRVRIEDRIKLIGLIVRLDFGWEFLNELNVTEEVRPGQRERDVDELNRCVKYQAALQDGGWYLRFNLAVLGLILSKKKICRGISMYPRLIDFGASRTAERGPKC